MEQAIMEECELSEAGYRVYNPNDPYGPVFGLDEDGDPTWLY